MKVLRVSHSAVVSTWRERERQLRDRGVDVRLLSAQTWDEGGAVVPLVPGPGEAVRGVRTVGSHPALFLYDPRPLWRALGEPWDVIDIHEEPFALATAQVLALSWLRSVLARRPAPPVVLYSAQNLTKRYPPPFRWLEAWALRTAAAVSVCNEEAGRICSAKGLSGRVEVIPLGVDPARFSPAPPRPVGMSASASLPADGAADGPADEPADGAGRGPQPRVVVGYAGRLAAHKGVDVLLRAVLADERLHLRVAGGGPAAPALRKAAAAAPGRITFLGSLDEADLPDFYRGLDVLAVPSLDTPTWVEQFGRVAVEAMACGTPVVASRSGALPDVVGGAGLLVPPGDSVALGEALARVGTDPVIAAGLREAGAARAATCSWPEVARRYHQMYSAITSAAPAAPVAQVAAAPADPPEVVVVAYGSPELLRTALAPLVGHFTVTVVDNSSLPRVREVTEAAGGRYLDPGHNGGFGAGVNYALAHRQLPGNDVLLLNPDAVVLPADVDALHRALRADPRAASAGPVQVGTDGSTARVRWPYPSPLGSWVDAAGLGRLRPVSDERSFVIGSLLLLRAEALAEVGGFDERFFLYAEETDWALRATRRGWRHVVVPQARAVHVGGGTSDNPQVRETHFHASQERYLRKHFGPGGWRLARTAVVVGSAGRSLVLRGPSRDSARRRLRLYLHGPVRAELTLTGIRRAGDPA